MLQALVKPLDRGVLDAAAVVVTPDTEPSGLAGLNKAFMFASVTGLGAGGGFGLGPRAAFSRLTRGFPPAGALSH